MENFFADNIIGVFFFYGLAFFAMGLAVLLEVSHSSELDFAKSLTPLAGFGLVHGGHEWIEMGLIIHTRLTGKTEPEWIFTLRLILLGVSFLFLVAFGARLIIGPGRSKIKLSVLAAVVFFWGLGLVMVLDSRSPSRDQLIAADVYTRYSLAIPGAALTTWGLILQRNRFRLLGMQVFGRDLVVAAIAFAMYGGIGQLFASPSSIFPSNYLNSAIFQNLFGFPVQVFRALMAVTIAIFIIRSLRAFDEENYRRIQALSEARRGEQERLQKLRGELLRRTVQAQEAERQRIARELHDETGQTLTAMGLGLRGLSQNIPVNPQRAAEQARQLEDIATNGLTELQRLVSGLHPPQLDELGLMAALRWYAEEVRRRYALDITVSGSVNESEIPGETRLAIFRIAQEAITNTIRHAYADHATVWLQNNGPTLNLEVNDDGVGFEAQKTLEDDERNPLGLMGMIERASLIGGKCEIISAPNEGTTVEVSVPLVRTQ